MRHHTRVKHMLEPYALMAYFVIRANGKFTPVSILKVFLKLVYAKMSIT